MARQKQPVGGSAKFYFAADKMDDSRYTMARTHVLCAAMKQAVASGLGELSITSRQENSMDFLRNVAEKASYTFHVIVAGDESLRDLTLELETLKPYGKGFNRIIGRLGITKRQVVAHCAASTFPYEVSAS